MSSSRTASPSSRASPIWESTIDTMHDALHATSSADPYVRNRSSTANSVGQISLAPALTLTDAGAPSSAPVGTERVSLRTTRLLGRLTQHRAALEVGRARVVD